ncbi:hypothetical protein ACFCW6_24510 [Streptomyces sp. NPDC056333]|uniref:hypothetical protein n=1 Tax=Streptomyces sp. NPDC056333 TaxID=3345786 RepID=UPI0035D71F1B
MQSRDFRSIRRLARIPRFIRRITVLAAALLIAALPTFSTPAAAAASFPVFVNERGTSRPTLEQYGSTRSTVVYDVFAFTCDTAGCYSNGGALPSEATYAAKVKEYMGAGQFGGAATAPVVLDFESIELTQVPTGQAATNAYNLWRQLLTWTHTAAPQAPVCHYGYDWLTQNQNLIKQLHTDNLLNCFAPRAYFYDGQTLTSWDSNLDQSVARDRAMAPSHPIYPYVNPTSFQSESYVPGNTWAHMFAKVQAVADGVVIWEPSAENANACAWISQHSYEMGVITSTGSSGPLKATAAPPSGNCTVTRGTTTTVPVTITNTSSSTTAATQMQSFADTPGFSGSWQYWNVPSLAPGASWSTSLPMAIASTQTAGTALLHIRTGLSDTRWVVIVQ